LQRLRFHLQTAFSRGANSPVRIDLTGRTTTSTASRGADRRCRAFARRVNNQIDGRSDIEDVQMRRNAQVLAECTTAGQQGNLCGLLFAARMLVRRLCGSTAANGSSSFRF